MDENKDCAPKRERFSVARCGGGGAAQGVKRRAGEGGKSVHAHTYTLLGGIFSQFGTGLGRGKGRVLQAGAPLYVSYERCGLSGVCPGVLRTRQGFRQFLRGAGVGLKHFFFVPLASSD
jgi:hypothetical protein